MPRQHSLHGAIESLSKKNDLQVTGNTVFELLPPKSKHDVGKGSRGKIDFLKKYHGFRHVWVDEFKR